MLYDKIIHALKDVKSAIKEKFGDDGSNKRGIPNYTSGPLGFDRIQYEISRVAAAIRHTTGGIAGNLENYTTFDDMMEDDTLYVDSKANPKKANKQSMINKFKTIGAMIADPRWNDDAVVKFTSGSDTRNESLVIQDLKRITLYAESAPDVKAVWLGSVALAGQADQITLSGITLIDTFTLGSNGEFVVAQNCTFYGNIISVASGIPTFLNLVRSWEKCCLTKNITLNGVAKVEYGFYECWAYEDDEGNFPTITLNNPNATLILAGLTNLKMHIVVLQGNVEVDAPVASLHTAGAGKVTLGVGKVCDPNNPQTLLPIYLNGTGEYTLGVDTHMRTGSTYNGKFQTSGIGSLQVRENGVHPGIIPRIDPADGTGRIPGVDPANTLKDWINGFSDAVVALQGGQAGIADGGPSDDGTQVNFYPDKIHKGDQYKLFSLPLSLFGVYAADEETIHMNGQGHFSLILDSGPIAEIIAMLQPRETGKGLSSNDFTAEFMAKLGALATIKSVTNENGQHLDPDGTLHQDDMWTPILMRIFSVGVVYETTNPAHNTPEKIAELFGFGTWEAFGPGRSTVAIDTTQTEFNEVGKIGGAKTVTLSVNEMPSHAHNSTIAGNRDGNPDGGNDSGGGKQYWRYGTTTAGTSSTGGGGAHNNLQPFIVLFRYRRVS